jgi:hypothetical protein
VTRVVLLQWRRFIRIRLFKRMVIATKAVQSIYRGHMERLRVGNLIGERRDWASYLRPNEAVVLNSIIRKKTVKLVFSLKSRRQLLLTSAPRLLYIDVAAGELRVRTCWVCVSWVSICVRLHDVY